MHVAQGATCPRTGEIEALAAERLSEDRRADALAHLEDCDACRRAFHDATAGDFPDVQDYTVIERIDQGGFGVVYRAVHHEKHRSEALKVLHGRTPDREAWFENEVHLVGKLRHPNIATLYEAHLSASPVYYCMELIEGRRLDRYLSEQPLTLADRVRIVRAVADAIAYAHRQGVIHRDIKPQNVLIDPAGQPRIVDFGIARKLGLGGAGEEAAEGPMGTIGYMAPEQAAGHGTDPRVDVYSLGALLYLCVTGRPPRTLRGLGDLDRRLGELGVVRLRDLAAILRRCLDPDAERRYAGAAELIADLDNYLVGRPTRAAVGDTPTYRARRVLAYVIRHHAAATGVAVVVAVALVLTLLLWKARAAVAGGPVDAPVDAVRLIAFTPETAQALREGRIGGDIPGLEYGVRKSWRMLHGRLLTRLAAGRPRVVALDYFMPDCQPQYDPAFLDGVRAVGAPVVVGVAQLDLNAEPLLCPAIRDAVRGWGMLHGQKPGDGPWAEVAVAMQRGFEGPLPSLAVAAFGAYRFPDSDVVVRVDERSLRAELRYRRREAAAGELRWREETDLVALSRVAEPPAEPLAWPFSAMKLPAGAEITRAGDRVAHMRVWLPADAAGVPVIPYERVLEADDAQLRAWFDGRAVVVAEVNGEADRFTLPDGRVVHGSEIQAGAIASMIGGVQSWRLLPPSAAARAFLWAAIAGLCMAFGPRLPHRARPWPIEVVAAICVALCAAGFALAALVATRVTGRFGVETGVALSAALSAGSLLFLLRAARERQMRLAPDLALPSYQPGDTTTQINPASESGEGASTPSSPRDAQ